MIKKRSPLSKEENLKLILKAKEEYSSSNGRNQESMQLAIEYNMGLVYSVYNSFYNAITQTGDNDGILSDCMFQLYKCILTFDIQKSQAFSSYAMRCISNTIKMKLRSSRRHRQKVVSLGQVLGYDKEGAEYKLQETLEDPKASDFETDLLERLSPQKYFQRLSLLLTDRQDELLKLRMQGLTYDKISQILGNVRTLYSRQMNKLYEEYRTLHDLSYVINLEEYIKQNNLTDEKEKEVRVKHAFSKYIFNNQRIDFDFCFDYIKYPLKEKGMLKKIDNIFQMPQNSRHIYYTLANLKHLDIDALRAKSKMAWQVRTSPNEKRLNNALIELSRLKGEIKHDLSLGLKVVTNWSAVQNMAILSYFSPIIRPAIQEIQTGFDKRTAQMFKTSQTKIKAAEALAEEQLTK